MRSLVWLAAPLVALALAAAPAAHAKEFRVVVFGDSYGSGEGAPAVNGNYGNDGSRLRGQGVLGIINEDSRGFPDPPADWNGNAADQDFTGDGPLAARRCHRSPLATAPRAVRALAAEFPDVDFEFRSFACSGARIDEGVLGSYEGAQPIDQENRVRPQLEQANDYLEGPSGSVKPVDALVMNIGGNNLGFGNVIQRCLNLPPYQGFEPCSPANVSHNGIGNDDTLRVIQTGEGSGEPEQVIGLDNLPDLYEVLNAKINRLPSATGARLVTRPERVYLTSPPNPAAGTLGGCLDGQYDYEKSLRDDEHAWLRDTVFPTLVDAMAEAAEDNGWTHVELGPAAPSNGMCAPSNRMFNRNRDSLRNQGATVASVAGLAVSHGIAHPNAAGFAATAPILTAALRPQVIDEFTPGPVAARGATPAPVVPLANRVQLRLADPPEDYATRPAGSTQAGPTAIGALGMGIGVVDVPVAPGAGSTTLLARRCGPLSPSVAPPGGCGPALSVPDVLTGTPATPTGVTVGATRQGVRVNWVKASPASVTPRRFLITASTSIATNSLIGNIPQTRDFTIAPGLRTTVLPLEAGSWAISVRECTDRGCSAPTAPIRVQSQGVLQFDPDDLLRPEFRELVTLAPVGIFTTPAGRRARTGRAFPLQIAWGVWRRWRELRDLRVRLIGERGELGTIGVKLGSRKVTVSGPDSRSRRGRLGRKGTLKARRFSLRTRKARIAGSGARGRLVAISLPLRLARRARGQRVDVDVAASLRDGTRQDFGPAGSFEVR